MFTSDVQLLYLLKSCCIHVLIWDFKRRSYFKIFLLHVLGKNIVQSSNTCIQRNGCCVHTRIWEMFLQFHVVLLRKNMVKSLLIQVLLIILGESITFRGSQRRSLIAHLSLIFIILWVYSGKKWSPCPCLHLGNVFWFHVVLRKEHGKELMNLNALSYFRWINQPQVEICENTRSLIACLTLMMFFESLRWWEMGSICWEKMDACIHFRDSNVDTAMGWIHLNMFSNMIITFHP